MPPSPTSSSTSTPHGGAPKTPSPYKAGYSYLGVRNTTAFKPVLSSSKTVRKQNSDDVNPGPSVDVEAEALEMLKVNYTSVYERLLDLPPHFTEDRALSPSAFSPDPVHPHDLAALFEEETIAGIPHLNLDYVRMVELFYPLVHPGIEEYTTDPVTGEKRRHTFCNLSILPDFIANNPAACRLLDLCP